MDISRRAYLRTLGILPTLSLSGVFSREVGATTNTESDWGEPVPTGSTRIPIDDPHITLGHGMSYTYGTDSGIPNLSRTKLATEMLKLHPDFWNQRYTIGLSGDPFSFEQGISPMARDGMDLAATLEVPASLGFSWMAWDAPVEERPTEKGMSGYLDDLPPEEQWPAPDGSPAEKPLHESTARDLSGSVRSTYEIANFANYPVSMYAPGPTDYHLDNVEKAPLYGANATEIDWATGASNLMKGDYSVWGKRAFREYLRDQPPNRLDRLDIDDISEFDIQSYAQNLRDDVYSGKRTEMDAIQDPIMYEFLLMEHRRLLEFYQSYSERGHTSAEKVESPLTTLGNQQSRIVSSKSNAAIILSQVYDLIEMENPITIPDQEVDSESSYLSSIRTATHKLVAAMKAVVDKPAVEHGFLGTGGWEGTLDPTNRYPTLQTLNFAEVYANGSTRQLDIDGWNNLPADDVSLMWLDPETGSVPHDILPLADFLWVYKQDLQGTPQSDVAVVYSMPTMLGKIRPFVGRNGDLEAKSVDGWVRAARERHIPTDMVIFGHPELWDDTETLDQLSEYQTLIFPHVSALTESQYEAIQEFAKSGGSLLYEGDFGTHDGYYRPRTEDITDLEAAIDVGDAGTKAANGYINTAGDAIEESLQTELIQVDGPQTLSCEVIETDDGWKNVHFVNYDYDSNQDAITEASDVSVSLHDSEKVVQDVDIIAPFDDRKSLDTERIGEYISVTVPEIAVWGIVRFKTGTRTSDASESEAENAISDASAVLDESSANGRSIPIARGEAAINEAELAINAEQYDRAVEKAEEAIGQKAPAQKELQIGIDSGHGQDPEVTYEGLSEFREKYRDKYEITFSEITSITPEQIAELDGLLIGSAFEYKGQSYSYNEEELAILERFVQIGGRIAVVVGEAVDDSINSLTERFGITVNPQRIYTLDMWDTNSIRTEPVQYRSPITYQIVDEGWEPHACSLTNLGEDVTVHMKSKPNTVRKGSSEEKRFPINAVSKRGKGAVVVQTSDELFATLKYQPEVQARNILRFIGNTENEISVKELTAEQTKTSTPAPENSDLTTNPTPSAEESDTTGTSASPTETVTSTSSPGFGTISALSGIISAMIYSVYRSLDREE